MENEFDVLMESFPKRKLRDFIEPINKRNSHLQYGPELIEGVNNLGEFVPTKAQIENVDMRPYKLVEKGDFVYNPSRLSIGSLAYRRNGKKMYSFPPVCCFPDKAWVFECFTFLNFCCFISAETNLIEWLTTTITEVKELSLGLKISENSKSRCLRSRCRGRTLKPIRG